MSETVEDACVGLTPFMAEVVIRLMSNEDISDILSIEEVSDMVGYAFRDAWQKMAS